MSVTDADREIARMVVGVWKHTGDDLAEIIAAQLAEEREKARAPFLELADELDGWRGNALRYAKHSKDDAVTGAMARARAAAYQRATDGLRRAAEDS